MSPVVTSDFCVTVYEYIYVFHVKNMSPLIKMLLTSFSSSFFSSLGATTPIVEYFIFHIFHIFHISYIHIISNYWNPGCSQSNSLFSVSSCHFLCHLPINFFGLPNGLVNIGFHLYTLLTILSSDVRCKWPNQPNLCAFTLFIMFLYSVTYSVFMSLRKLRSELIV